MITKVRVLDSKAALTLGGLVLAIIAAWLFLSRPVEAAKRYQYEVVQVSGHQASEVINKRTSDGWEPTSLTFFPAGPTGSVEGYILFRK